MSNERQATVHEVNDLVEKVHRENAIRWGLDNVRDYLMDHTTLTADQLDREALYAVFMGRLIWK